jgi:hypothetical protein
MNLGVIQECVTLIGPRLGLHKEIEMQRNEFKEIGHSGGQVIFHVKTEQCEHPAYKVEYRTSRPVPVKIYYFYALPQGVVVAPMVDIGLNRPPSPPPFPGCYPVFLASDSEERFGQQCPKCDRYWRCGSMSTTCPYCGNKGESIDFLTTAQQKYIYQYCQVLSKALDSGKDGDYKIDLDAVADAVGKDTIKPEFYYAEESQQNQFTCKHCGNFNDILGKFGYCAVCGTRNDLQEFKEKIISKIRDRINLGGSYETCVKDSVSAFDSFVGKYITQLSNRIPMTPRRKDKFDRMLFHNLITVKDDIEHAFDINIITGIGTSDIEFVKKMFHRRHVYEHKGGEADEKYIRESGDSGIRVKQTLHETQETAHRLANLVTKMAENLHKGFHEIFPPDLERIKEFNNYRKRFNTKETHAKRFQAKSSG